jgi:hypothetical protein
MTGCHCRDNDRLIVVVDADERATLIVPNGRVQHHPDARLAKVQPGSRVERDGRRLA